jgi:hypothetical protein
MKRFEYDQAYALFKYDRARVIEEADMWRLAQQAKGKHPNSVSHIRKLLNTGFRLLEVRRGKRPEPQQLLRKRIIG